MGRAGCEPRQNDELIHRVLLAADVRLFYLLQHTSQSAGQPQAPMKWATKIAAAAASFVGGLVPAVPGSGIAPTVQVVGDICEGQMQARMPRCALLFVYQLVRQPRC